MAQFLRPSQDISLASWVNESNSSTDVWASIDESVASDTDHAKQGNNNTADTYEVKLSAGSGPNSTSNPPGNQLLPGSPAFLTNSLVFPYCTPTVSLVHKAL